MSTNIKTLRIYWKHISRHKPSFFTGLLCIPLASLLLDTVLPYFLSQAVGMFAQPDSGQLVPLLILAGAAGFTGVALNFTGFQAIVMHESRVRVSLVDDILSRILAKDYAFFSSHKIGALTGKFIDFINSHVGLQDLFIIRTLTFGLNMSIGIAIILSHSLLLGLVIFVLMSIILVQVRVSLRLRRPLRKARKELIGELNGAVADTISNNLTVKTFANEKHEISQTRSLSEKYRQAYARDIRWLASEGSLRIMMMVVVQLATIFIMAQLLQRGSIELGIAIFVVAYLQRVASQLFALGEIINGYDKIFLQAAPMTEILETDDAVTNARGAGELRVPRGEITFDDMSYAYSDARENNVIEHLSLTIKPGERIGLIGRSGAGKTTLTKTLLRFDNVTGGRILIDGQDIAAVTQESLRRAIAYVPQEPLLFHRNLRENIAYGKLDATDKEIREAAERAHALEFIDKLPGGFDTIVGERGVKLSGGQRQRIAIARAILKDAPILLLDEATGALDSESEKLIQDALARLMAGRTSIVIAHRLSTIAKLDRIIVLEAGRIAEQGAHAELLARSGIYASLWRHQSGGFIEE